MTERCVCCNAEIPEGRQVCYSCIEAAKRPAVYNWAKAEKQLQKHSHKKEVIRYLIRQAILILNQILKELEDDV